MDCEEMFENWKIMKLEIMNSKYQFFCEKS